MLILHKSLIRMMRLVSIFLVAMLFSACSHQVYTSEEHRVFNLTAADLFQKGIAFTTPIFHYRSGTGPSVAGPDFRRSIAGKTPGH